MIVKFPRCTIHKFGSPNDETLHGHPLHKLGLEHYAFFEVHNSSWIHSLELMNSVHSQHTKEWFMKGKRHFAFTFHDSMFECVAYGYSVEKVSVPIRDLISQLISEYVY